MGNRGTAMDAAEFFREILVTYRVLFGETRSSRQSIKKYVKKLESSNPGNFDPLVPILCQRPSDSQEARVVYDWMGVEATSNHYLATDFPYWGEKLIQLQSHVKVASPRATNALGADKRDLSRWWTFWVSLQQSVDRS